MKVNYFRKGADVSQSENIKVTAVEVKAQTIDRRRLHNRNLRKFAQALPLLRSLGPRTVPFVLVANSWDIPQQPQSRAPANVQPTHTRYPAALSTNSNMIPPKSEGSM